MSQATLSHWSYLFGDGSRLVGQFCGELEGKANHPIQPTQMRAEYWDGDGETLLGSWEEKDFACFELSEDGSEIAIVASNDGFVANSMCLVFCSTRSRAQVTDWGSQLSGEPFEPSAWSITPEVPPAQNYNWLLPPLLPSISLTWRLPHSRTSYHWTFSPLLPFAPILRVEQMAARQGDRSQQSTPRLR